MEVSFYHPEIGHWQAIEEPSQEILNKYPPGTKRIPLCPGPGYTFNGTKWVAPTQAWLDDNAAKIARAERAALLYHHVDPVVSNPLRWNSMTQAQRDAWAAYRQALLDISQQTGFPHEIEWPTKPA